MNEPLTDEEIVGMKEYYKNCMEPKPDVFSLLATLDQRTKERDGYRQRDEAWEIKFNKLDKRYCDLLIERDDMKKERDELKRKVGELESEVERISRINGWGCLVIDNNNKSLAARHQENKKLKEENSKLRENHEYELGVKQVIIDRLREELANKEKEVLDHVDKYLDKTNPTPQ